MGWYDITTAQHSFSGEVLSPVYYYAQLVPECLSNADLLIPAYKTVRCIDVGAPLWEIPPGTVNIPVSSLADVIPSCSTWPPSAKPAPGCRPGKARGASSCIALFVRFNTLEEN